MIFLARVFKYSRGIDKFCKQMVCVACSFCVKDSIQKHRNAKIPVSALNDAYKSSFIYVDIC